MTPNVSHRMDWQALIESQPALATITAELRAVADHLEFEAGETLFRLGDRLKGVFCITAGEVRLIRRACSELCFASRSFHQHFSHWAPVLNSEESAPRRAGASRAAPPRTMTRTLTWY